MDAQRVFVPLQDGQLMAIERETGDPAWFEPVQTVWAPVARDGAVFVATANAIKSFDASTGAERWSTPIPATLSAPLRWDTGWLLAILKSGEILGLRAADGARIWSRALGAPSRHPAIPGDHQAVYLSLNDGRVVSVALADGQLLWEVKLPGTLSEPATARDRVFVGSTNNFFYALDSKDGELEWKWRAGGDVIGAAVDAEDVVYFASLDNVLRAVNRTNGNQRWKQELTTRPALPPRTFGGVVVLTGVAPETSSFIAKTGEPQSKYVAPADLQGAPILDTALRPFSITMVVVTRDGRVVALRSTALMFREAPAAPFPALPGRRLERERWPHARPAAMTSAKR